MDLALLIPWAQFILFGLMSLMFIGSNITSLIEARRCGGNTSLTLFLGGVFGVIAVLACPIEGAWVWFWVPVILDPGSLFTLVKILREDRKS